LRHCFI